MSFVVSAFYKFTPLTSDRIATLKLDLEALAERTGLQGLLLLGPEGCNATVAGTLEAVSSIKNYLGNQEEFSHIEYKDTFCDWIPFRRFKIDLREEIVTLGRADLVPADGPNNHLSPKEWHRVLTEESDVVLIDTRNAYETEIGKFKHAIDPNIQAFGDFPNYVRASGISKEKKVLMYCTGGIRCEKAMLFMKDEGYRNVYQLEGGILNYLKEYPSGEFEGECFVFDHRVAVDSFLAPSKKYKLCPHCGNPANIKIECEQCDTSAVICFRCAEVPKLRTCSKNCAHHLGRTLIASKQISL